MDNRQPLTIVNPPTFGLIEQKTNSKIDKEKIKQEIENYNIKISELNKKLKKVEDDIDEHLGSLNLYLM